MEQYILEFLFIPQSTNGQRLKIQFTRTLWSHGSFMKGHKRRGDRLIGISSALKVEVVTFISTQRKKKNSLFLILISGHHRHPSL